MASARDCLVAEVPEYSGQVRVEGIGEIATEATSPVAGNAEAKPVLLHLGEAVPGLDKVTAKAAGLRLVSEKAKVSYHLIVQFLIFLFFAVEEKEWVDKQREVCHDGDVESAVVIQGLLGYAENIREKQVYVLRFFSGIRRCWCHGQSAPRSGTIA